MAALLRRAALRQQTRGYRAPAASINHCIGLVRQYDQERFLCNIHAPQAARAGLFALHAFNIETAKIRGSTSDPNIGRMRLLWWRQAIAQAAEGSPPDQPVLHALAHAGATHRWTWRYLEQMLDAREADLDLAQPESRQQLLWYCERTSGALCLLACECVSTEGENRIAQASPELVEQAALQVGAALGIATVLRGHPQNAMQGVTYIPADVAARHGLEARQAVRGIDSDALSDAVQELAGDAIEHLLAARSLRRELPPAIRAALLPASIAELILHKLQACRYAPYAPQMAQPLGLRLQLALGWHWLRGTF